MDAATSSSGVHRRKNKGNNKGGTGSAPGSRRNSSDEGQGPSTSTASTSDPAVHHDLSDDVAGAEKAAPPALEASEDTELVKPSTHTKLTDSASASSSSSSADFLERLNDRSAWILPLLVFALATFTRFYRIDQPPGVVFDESHFGRFTNQYTKGEYFFDIHPPLGKLTFWFVGRLVGYDATVCDYSKIDKEYAPDCKFIWLRATAAFFGSLTAPVMFLLARNFGASLRGSLLTSLFFIFDGLNSSEARWVLIDSQLLFWVAFCALVGQYWFARWNRHCGALDLFEARLIVAADVHERNKEVMKDDKGGSSDSEINKATIRAILSPELDAEAEATIIVASAANALGGGEDAARRAVNGPTAGTGTPMEATAQEPLFQRLFNYGDDKQQQQASSSAVATTTNSRNVALVSAQKSLPQAVQDAAFFKLQKDPRFMTLADRAFWILAVGLACGNAVSVKFTGLATPAMLGLESLFAIYLLKRSYPFPDLFGILVTGTLLFYFYWWVHFALLTSTGDGDVFMMADFVRTLKGNPQYDPNAQRPNFWWLATWLVQDMIKANAGILEPHAWQSTWDEWLLNLRGVLYYSVDKKHTYTQAIYLLGNPVVIWGLGICIVLAALLMVLWQRYRFNPDHDLSKFKPFFAAIAWCLTLYALNLLPYLGVKRSCFAYHWMPAGMYNEILAGLLIDQLAGRKWMPSVFKLVCLVVVGCYLFFAPWIYGFALNNEGHDRRRWLPRWN